MLSMNLEGPQMLEGKDQRESFKQDVQMRIMGGNKGKERSKEGKRGCKGSKSLLVLGRLISQIQVLFDLLKIHPTLEIIVLPLYHVIRRSRVEYSTLHILMHI